MEHHCPGCWLQAGCSGVVLQLWGQWQCHNLSIWGHWELLQRKLKRCRGCTHTPSLFQSLVDVFIHTIYATAYFLEWDLLTKARERRTCPKTKHTFWFPAEQSWELGWKKPLKNVTEIIPLFFPYLPSIKGCFLSQSGGQVTPSEQHNLCTKCLCDINKTRYQKAELLLTGQLQCALGISEAWVWFG